LPLPRPLRSESPERGAPEREEPPRARADDVVERQDSIAKNTAFSFASQLTTASLTAVLTIVLVCTLGPVGNGLFALAMSISALALTASDLGISAST